MTLRWKAHARKILGVTDLIEDAGGSRRALAEGGWLAVVYPPDRSLAYVETVERAPVRRGFASAQATQGGTTLYVADVRIASSVGEIVWAAAPDVPRCAPPRLAPTAPVYGVLPGRLRLPDGSERPTGTGGGIFEAPGWVKAYKPWRDEDSKGGWGVVTEVGEGVPEELRPLLAALPLLMFTHPPLP